MKREGWIILGVALIVRLFLALFTAVGDGSGLIPSFNDEPAHLRYVRYLAVSGRLPVQTTSVRNGLDAGEFEYYQPPLYYVLARPFYTLGMKLTPGREILWVRGLSVLFTTAGLIILYLAVRNYFSQRHVARGVLLLAACGGLPLRFGSIVTNDSLFFALACLCFALILEILKSGCDLRLLLAGILIVSAGLWTKASFLLLLPLFPWALLRGPNRSTWRAVVALIIPLLAILPWYLRNQALYGYWIPISVGFGPPEPLASSNLISRLYILVNYFTRSLVFPYDGFWGGWLDKVIYPAEGSAFLLLLWLGMRTLRTMQRDGFWIFAGAIALNLVGYLYLNYNYSQAEARYFIPALPFLLTVMALGADKLSGVRKSRVYALLGVWIILPWLSVLF